MKLVLVYHVVYLVPTPFSVYLTSQEQLWLLQIDNYQETAKCEYYIMFL